MESSIIDLRDGPHRRDALVAMGAGAPRDAVVAVLAGVGAAVVVTVARGLPLLEVVEDRGDDLAVVELSRLGEAGLVGLAATARRRPATSIVLLLPGGLGGPTAATLGIEAVVDESDIATLRTAVRRVLLPVGDQPR